MYINLSLTILISSLSNNIIRPFTYLCIRRYIDGVSCIFLQIC